MEYNPGIEQRLKNGMRLYKREELELFYSIAEKIPIFSELTYDELETLYI